MHQAQRDVRAAALPARQRPCRTRRQALQVQAGAQPGDPPGAVRDAVEAGLQVQFLPGESAAALFRRRFFEGLDAGAYQTAFHEGSEVWTRTVHDSPALMARQREIARRAAAARAFGLLERGLGDYAAAPGPPARDP